jgi:hypothetical protein
MSSVQGHGGLPANLAGRALACARAVPAAMCRPGSQLMTAVDETFKAIRQACSAGLWSRAVELVRASAVAGVSESDEEIVCRVRTPSRVVAPKVTLYPLDEEWDCDCDSKLPCCEHIAAAIIAVRRAQQEGVSLPSDARSGAHPGYRFKTAKAPSMFHQLGRLTLWSARPASRRNTMSQAITGRWHHLWTRPEAISYSRVQDTLSSPS